MASATVAATLLAVVPVATTPTVAAPEAAASLAELLQQLLLPWVLLVLPWRLPTWLNGSCVGGWVFGKKFLMSSKGE
jgi:hypothetical protein